MAVRRLRRLWGLAGVVIVVALGYVLLTLFDSSGPATAAGDRGVEPGYPERPVSGLVAALPFVGSLTWHCEEGGERFATQLWPPDATIYVSLSADGRRVWKRKRVDPLANPKVKLLVGTPLARRSQTWTISYHHKPATISVTARLRFRASEGQCVIAHSAITTHRTPH